MADRIVRCAHRVQLEQAHAVRIGLIVLARHVQILFGRCCAELPEHIVTLHHTAGVLAAIAMQR
jgi:formyltetrahydrofolate hydrolase